jgi:hypothetical protein
MSHWYIIGKHPRGLEYKGLADWQNVNSIGLNDASYLYGTKYAMTGHKKPLESIYENAYTTNVIIPDTPFCKDIQIIHPAIRIRHGHIETSKDQPYHVVKRMVEDAIKKRNRKYFQFWTILHLAICYVLMQGAKEITLIGSNQTNGTLPGMLPGAKMDYQRRHTEMMVKACREFGIKVNWLK